MNTSGTTGYGNTGTNQGPHNSAMANKLDPRVDSDGDGRAGVEGRNTGNPGYNTSGTGNSSFGTMDPESNQPGRSSQFVGNQGSDITGTGNRGTGTGSGY